MEDIVAMARAAEKDERLSDGALYGKLADRIELQEQQIKEWQEKWLALAQASAIANGP
jgi:hypothetical protein